MEKKQVTCQGIPIQYFMAGKGRPVMLLHGFGEDARIWHHLVNELKNNYLLITPNIPGSGGTSYVDKEGVTLEDYADILHEILLKENIHTITLLGHSMGGYITMAMAEKHPAKLDAIGLIHSSSYADDAEKKNIRKKGIAFIQQYGAPAFIKTTIPALFKDVNKSKDDIQWLTENTKDFKDAPVIQYYSAMMNRPDRSYLLSQFEKPVLFLLGQYDKVVPINDGIDQAQMPALSFVHILKDSAHMGMLEEKEKTYQIVKSFLDTTNQNKMYSNHHE